MTSAAVLIADPVASGHASPVARDCPACGVDRALPLFDNAMVGIDDFAFGYPVAACGACGMVYATRALDRASMADYYRTLSKYDDAGGPSPFDAHRARAAAAFVARVAGRDRRLLDVGCSTGTFLAEARAAGFAHTAGIEPAPAAVDVARRQGLDVAVGDANTFEGFADHDVVALLAVLEHLATPRAFVERVARSMRRDALLIVEVPNADAFGDYAKPGVATEPFGEFSIEHINFFGHASLARLGRAAGLSIVATETIDYLNGWGGLFVALRNDGGRAADDADGDRSRRSVARYVERSEAAMRGVDERLAMIREPVIVYGAGSHSARLLTRDAARAIEIRAIVDRNRNLVDRSMAGIPIAAPEAIARHPGLPVIVSTFNARAPIIDFVATRFGNEPFALYPAS